VIVDGLVVAVVLFGCLAGRPAWTVEERAVLGRLADYAGHALAHGLSYQHTRDTALTLQRSLLTEPPAVPGLDIRVRYRPAGADEVGGDWYDAFLLDDGTLAVTVGDVVGHDIAAAAAMGQLRATLRSLAVDRDEDPAAILDRLDLATRRLRITPFATLVHGHLRRDATGGGNAWTLRWAAAGHPAPLLLCADAAPRWLDGGAGLVIGTGLPQPARTGATTVLRPGDTLLLYTDGLVERRGHDLARSMTDLATTAAAHAGRPVDALCDALLADAPTEDDVAILAVRPLSAAG
jgi:serine phosphatase RsbU (regulator of sigma subunit)